MWGPGDSHPGVDELVCQFDGLERGHAWWAVQDLTGDVVALLHKPTSAAASVVWQCTYEPYGGVLAAATLAAHPPLHLGHKGLFVDNLDTVEFTAVEPDNQPRLVAQRPLLYHIRNRSLLAGEPVDESGAPRVWAGNSGRFLQPDPNATGAAITDHLPCHGQQLLEPIPQASFANWIGDGVHALGYCQSSPTTCGDPLGLFPLLDPLLSGWDMAQGALGLIDDAHRGNMLAFGLSQILTGYATNQEFLFSAVGDESLSDGLIQGLQADGARIAQFGFFTISRGNNSIMDEGNPWWVPLMAGSAVPASAPTAGSATPSDVMGAFAAAKQHGSDQHFMQMYRDTLSLVQNYDIDPASIQINRAVRDNDGNIIRDKDGSYKRPDVHMRTRDGKLVVLEVGVSQTTFSLEHKGVWYSDNLGPHDYHIGTPDSPLHIKPRRKPGRRR